MNKQRIKILAGMSLGILAPCMRQEASRPSR